jgi:hypothetical protein
MTHRTRTAVTALAAVFPEIAVGLAVWRAWHARVAGDDPERGDAIQWVILTAVGAAIAITVGTIIYTKLQNKANSIDVTTPAANN